MPSLQDIRRRIRSVKNTQQVTKAMKMISAVKLRKSQDRLLALRPYAAKLHGLVAEVVGRFEDGTAPETPLAKAFLKPRGEARIQVAIVASDKGLCGGFNANLLKTAEAFLQDTRADVVRLDLVGKRAVDWARKRKLEGGIPHAGVPLEGLLDLARELAEEAVRRYAAGELDAFYILHNHFNSALSQAPKVVKVFPVAPPAAPSGPVSHLLEPDAGTVLEALLPRFVEIETLRGLLESATSEHAARMSAMDKASSNAAEMIDKLTLNMNKVRQAAITNQIIEVVSGAAS